MPVVGTAKWWDTEQGFGVVCSPDVDGEVWTHFMHIEADGYRELHPGEPVEFEYRMPGQDGFPYVAEWVKPLGRGRR